MFLGSTRPYHSQEGDSTAKPCNLTAVLYHLKIGPHLLEADAFVEEYVTYRDLATTIPCFQSGYSLGRYYPNFSVR